MGCMRLSTDLDRDLDAAKATVRAAVAAGVNLFDTAAAYGHDETEIGHNERLLREASLPEGVTIVTKAGMKRSGSRWIPDGKRKSILDGAAASCEALGVDTLDLLLLHTPDPRTSWSTSVRALETLLARGVVKRVGVSNVTLTQLEEAMAVVPVAAVENRFSVFDDSAVRGGVVECCLSHDIPFLAHSPFGGPKRCPTLLRRFPELGPLAERRKVSAQTLVLAWLYDLSPLLVPIPGARRVETARDAGKAASLELSPEERERLDAWFEVARLVRTPRAQRAPSHPKREVVLVMGIPGAGKSTHAARFVENGYERLNRDARGGSLKQIAAALETRLAEGGSRFVLDNTYATRAQRNLVIETAWRFDASVRCVWLDTPLEEAQINAVNRMLDRYGELLAPERLEGLDIDPNTFGPHAQFRFRDAFEEPRLDEGFLDLERIAFKRTPRVGDDGLGWIVALERLRRMPELLTERRTSEKVLVLAWLPEGTPEQVRVLTSEFDAEPDVEVGVCVHPAGRPRCWCRKPLPGLAIAWMRRHRIAPAQSRYSGAGPSDRTLADRLGLAYEDQPA